MEGVSVSISYSFYAFTEFSLSVWRLVTALCGICLWEWCLNAKLSGIHLYQLSKKKNSRKSLQYFANIPSRRDFFPVQQKMFHFHRQLLLNNWNNFPWVKILGTRNHVIIFIYLNSFMIREGCYYKEASPFICSENYYTGFDMKGTSVMKVLRNILENDDVGILCKNMRLCKTLYKILKINVFIMYIFDSWYV